MNRATTATGNATFQFCPYEFSKCTRFRPWLTSHNNQKLFSDGAGLVWQRRRRRRQQIGLESVAAAELSSPLSFNLGLDSQLSGWLKSVLTLEAKIRDIQSKTYTGLHVRTSGSLF